MLFAMSTSSLVRSVVELLIHIIDKCELMLILCAPGSQSIKV